MHENKHNCISQEYHKMSSQQKGVDLTDEDQVQDYLDNLGIEYRFGCYEEKSPKSCQLLGEYFESITREFDKALQIFETNCLKNNHGPSCSKAGFYLASGNGGIQPDPVSVFFEKQY